MTNRPRYAILAIICVLLVFQAPLAGAVRSGAVAHAGVAPIPVLVPYDAVSPTATVAVTLTATATATATTVVTPTNTATLVPTATLTPTATATPTPTATATPTNTPTATASPTQTPTSTATATATPKPKSHSSVRARITVSPGSINPGGLLTVKGSGFSHRESIQIGLDNKTYATTHATSSGSLSSTAFAVPLTISSGHHTVFARGSSSHRRATATVSVGKLHPNLRLNQQSVTVGARLCATGTSYLPREGVTVAVNSVAITSTVSSTGGSFTVCFAVPANVAAGTNTVTADGAISRASASAHFTARLSIASTFYFAGASTAGGDDTEIPIVNPQSRSTKITLRFYLPDAASFDRSLTVAAHTRATLVLSTYVGGVQFFGLRLQADRNVAAQMVVRRGANNPYTTLGNSLLETRWYLPEGYTGLSFHETLVVLNPQSSPATVQVRLLPFNGGAERVATYTVPAQRTYSIDVNRLYPRASVAAVVESGAPTMVTRVITFGSDGYGATANSGAAQAATTWLFAEGSTANGFQTFLTILNPSARPATVTALLYDTSGHLLGGRSIVVDPLHRGNMRLNDTRQVSSIATYVTSTQPIVVERPLYFGDPNNGRSGGSIVFGRNGADLSWTFPAGDTSLDAREFLLALNPNPVPLTLHATFYLTNGHTVEQTFTVPASARLTIDVNRMVPVVNGTLHSTQLAATGSLGFIAEQSIYSGNLTLGYSTAGLAQ